MVGMSMRPAASSVLCRKDESDAPLNALAVRPRNAGAPSVMMTGPSTASIGDIKQDSISLLHVTNVYFMLERPPNDVNRSGIPESAEI